MAAEIEIVPHDDRGIELLDELEERTGDLPFKLNTRTGARTYYLETAGTDFFDTTLDNIEPNWRRHLTRTL